MASAEHTESTRELERSASYHACRTTSNFPWIVLAHSGFRYAGRDQTVVCDGCGQEKKIESFDSKPSDAKHHVAECKFSLTTVTLSLGNAHSCNRTDTVTEEEISWAHATKPNLLDNNGASGPTESPASFNDRIHSFVIRTNDPCPVDVVKDENEEIIDPWNPCVVVDAENVNRGAHTFLTKTLKEQDIRKNAAVGDLTSEIHTTSEEKNHPSGTLASSDSSSENSQLYLINTSSSPEYDTFHNCTLTQPLPLIYCSKNPRHLNYHQTQRLHLDDFPGRLRSDELRHLLVLCADLTAKIVVNCTSAKRSALDPVWKLPPKPRVGTGSALSEPCQIHIEPVGRTFQRGRVFIETHRQLIFDNEEARSCTAEFFSHCSNTTTLLTGDTMHPSSIPGDDKAILTCNVFDQQFINQLNNTQQEFARGADHLPLKVKKILTDKIVIVGHPHGGEKALSFGDSTMVNHLLHIQETNERSFLKLLKINDYKYAQSHLEWTRRSLMHTADTCPGMCGAPIIRFKMTRHDNKPSFALDTWMHHGVDNAEDLNISVLKVCTDEDVRSWGIPGNIEVTRSQMSTQSQVSTRTGGQDVVTVDQAPLIGPSVLAAATQPSYPVYYSIQKRVESFAAWPRNHTFRPNDLSTAGFFYAGYSDCIRCFQCGLGLRSWKPGDDVNEEHERHRPSCPFLRALLHRDAASIASPGVNVSSASADNVTAQNTEDHIHAAHFGRTLAVPRNEHEIPRNGSQGILVYNDSEVRSNSEVLLSSKSLSGAKSQTGGDNLVLDNASRQDNFESINSPQDSPLSTEIPTRLLQREHRALAQQLMCKVCNSAPIKELFLPCGDLYACSECSKRMTHCQSCNKLILATVVTYFT